MGWEATLLTTLLLLMAAFLTGAPLFVAFLVINLAGVAIFHGPAAFGMVANSIFDTAIMLTSRQSRFCADGGNFIWSGSVDILFDAVDKLVGRMKGRQYVLTISLSTVFGALSGSGMAVAAMLARTLFPTMRNRGYDASSPSEQCWLAQACADYPPSVLAIVIGTLSNTSIAGLLSVGSFQVCCWRDCS